MFWIYAGFYNIYAPYKAFWNGLLPAHLQAYSFVENEARERAYAHLKVHTHTHTQTYLYRINNIQQCTVVTHKIYCKVLIRNMIQLAHLLPSSIHKHTKYKFVHRKIRFYNAITMFAWYFICVECERWKRTKEWANQPTSQLTNRNSEIRAEEMKKTINQFISSEKHGKSNALVFEDEENAGRCKILNTYMWCACVCMCARVL